ncbi:hypothetical protein ACFVHB_38580 [Kitasatospora sp. NPDC127111]|uniref:hypothetical protein n=1 Tax=Kitasatospora sp. NPDC127111 TaxID=3345363 RepID=UPI00362E808E
MPNSTFVGHGATGGTLEKHIQGEPLYPIAQDLLGIIIGKYSSMIWKAENSAPRDEELIRHHAAAQEPYYAELRRLRELDGEELAEAVSRYESIIRDLRSDRYEQPR